MPRSLSFYLFIHPNFASTPGCEFGLSSTTATVCTQTMPISLFPAEGWDMVVLFFVFFGMGVLVVPLLRVLLLVCSRFRRPSAEFSVLPVWSGFVKFRSITLFFHTAKLQSAVHAHCPRAVPRSGCPIHHLQALSCPESISQATQLVTTLPAPPCFPNICSLPIEHSPTCQ